jgi:hypothetical protein
MARATTVDSAAKLSGSPADDGVVWTWIVSWPAHDPSSPSALLNAWGEVSSP